MKIRMQPLTLLPLVPALALTLTLLTGCAADTPVASPSTNAKAFSGHVIGGTQPVSGATIQLYASGLTGVGAASRPLLSAPLPTTDANGKWSIPAGAVTCPADDPYVYVLASGGDPAPGVGPNSAIKMIAALNDCDSLSSSTVVTINEVTTVAAVFSLAPYMTGYANVGSSFPPSQLDVAYTVAQELANSATGTAPGPMLPANSAISVPTLYTLANVVSACVDSAGGVAGDGTACGTLFQAAKPSSGAAPTDTVGLLLDIANNPTQNTPTEYGLTSTFGSFQPTLSSAPTSWALPILTLKSFQVFGANDQTVGDTQQIVAVAGYSDGSSPNVSGQTTWSSSNTSVATINSAGLMTAVGAGTTTITGSFGGDQSTLGVTVYPGLVSIALSPAPNASVATGSVIPYILIGTYADGAQHKPTETATYASSNTSVAALSGPAQFYGVATGTTTITATLGSLTATSQLTVYTPPQTNELLPIVTSFTANTCSYDPIIFANCTFSFTAANLVPGVSYAVSDISVCNPSCVSFAFTATATTYTTPSAVAPTSCPVIHGINVPYGDCSMVVGGLSNGYLDMIGLPDGAIISVTTQGDPLYGYTNWTFAPFTWPAGAINPAYYPTYIRAPQGNTLTGGLVPHP